MMIYRKGSKLILSRTKARFVSHEPCPKCGSRDNLGRYSDGSAWCFGCSYFEPAIRTIENSRNNNNNETISNLSVFNFSNSLPKDAIFWLKKYGLTNEEISNNNFVWDSLAERLVYPVYGENGEILFWQGRAFGKGPKYISWGKIPVEIYLGKLTRTLIFTEDVVSAIKVARHTTASPLFGSNLPANRLNWACERFSGVGLWLDPDKRTESLKAVIRGQMVGHPVFGIYSDKDPKEHSDKEIELLVNDAVKHINT